MKNKMLCTLAVLLFIGQAALAQQADYGKLSGLMITKLNEYENHVAQARLAKKVVKDVLLMPLVKADSEETLTRQGVHVFDHVGNIYFTAMPMSRVAELSNDEGVARIELLETPKPMMDQTPGIVGVSDIYNAVSLPQAYTGKGVLVGISDGMFDYTHPMFQNANGTTRIRWAWDMYTGRGTKEGYLGIGSLYDTPEKLAKARGSIDSVGIHGTHVAGIAAGSPVLNGKYRGIAYESDIALITADVSNNVYVDENTTLGNLLYADVERAKGGNAEIANYVERDYYGGAACLLGIKRFFDYATQQGMPAVLNCSWGNSETYYNDFSLLEEVFNELTKVPGHIIVSSSGNDSDTDYYRAKKANETLSETLNYMGASDTDESPYSLYITTKGNFKVFLSATFPIGEKNEGLAVMFDSQKPNDKDSHVLSLLDDDYTPHYFGFKAVYLRDLKDGRKAYRLDVTMPQLAFFPQGTTTRKADLMVICDQDYVVNGSFSHISFTRGFGTNLADHTVSIPATYDCVLAVGATNHRSNYVNQAGASTSTTYNNFREGLIVSWSGTGPTFDGRTKPDVCAPGFNIISADNSNLIKSFAIGKGHQNGIVEQWQVNGRTYGMSAVSGTSMAAPVVSGIVALWLQAKPTLTLTEIKDALAATAKHLDPEITYPNNIFGYGEIDAYAGLLKILNIDTAIPELPRQQVQVSLNGQTLRIEGQGDALVTIYNLNGQQMLNTHATDGTVLLPNLPNGVYAVKVGNQGSTLIRL
ncbi:MAG: S8 family peptidase [Prevotella sp.]|nr:S8 family peptidase [Prevotella sp.]